MKVKGIPVYEQHVEKIVLAAVTALALFFAATQFLGRGNVIEIDDRERTANEVDSALESKANAIRGLLAEEAQSTVKLPKPPGLLEWVRTAASRPVSPPGGTMIPGYVLALGTGRVEQADKLFLVPTLAGAGKPEVAQYADAVAQDLLLELPDDLQQVLGTGGSGPHDFSWTTPYLVLDVKALREQLAATDPADERLPIPGPWYDNRVYVIDVEMEREELVGGQWTDPRIVAAMPDLREHRDRINGRHAEGPMTVTGKDALLDWLRERANQAFIIQPEFLTTTTSTWTQPELAAEEEAPEMTGITKLRQRIAAQERVLERLTAQLERAGGEMEAPSTPQPPPGGGGRRGGGGGGGGGGPGIPGGGGTGGGSGQDIGGQGGSGAGGNENIRINLTKRKREIEATIDELNRRLVELAQELGIELNPDTTERRLPDLVTDDAVLVWGHDLDVTTGATYRYRLTVRLYNPFFGRGAFLVDQQEDLAKDVCMNVQTSEWSEPVTVKPHTRFFVTQAQSDDSGGALGVGQTKIEVYRLFQGQWFMHEWTVQPGEPIGEIETAKSGDMTIDVDFRTDAFVQDVLRTPDEKVGSPGAGRSSKVVVAFPDGTTVIRDPATDTNDPERAALAGNITS